MLGVIFDCDGTLVDSEYVHFLSWQKALHSRGADLTSEEYIFCAGQPGTLIAQRLHAKIPLQESPLELFHDKRRHYAQFLKNGLIPMERMVKFARALALLKESSKIKLAVASAAGRDEILSSLQHIDLEDIFDLIVSGEDDLSHYSDPEGVNKPKPYIYLHTVKQLGLLPSECVAFEDSGPGVRAAATAGLVTFAVPNSYTKQHDFSLATHVIDPTVSLTIPFFFHLLSKD
jgi:HAD superfamily hydrolase (TIGR01509 family)